MINLWVSDIHTIIRTAASRIQQLAGGKIFILMTKLEFLSTKKYNLTYIINFWVSDFHTWIRMADSRNQQLPGVQIFIFDAKFGIQTQKT